MWRGSAWAACDRWVCDNIPFRWDKPQGVFYWGGCGGAEVRRCGAMRRLFNSRKKRKNKKRVGRGALISEMGAFGLALHHGSALGSRPPVPGRYRSLRAPRWAPGRSDLASLRQAQALSTSASSVPRARRDGLPNGSLSLRAPRCMGCAGAIWRGAPADGRRLPECGCSCWRAGGSLRGRLA